MVPAAEQPTMKVWRPEGVEGLELEKFENAANLLYPPFILQTYDLTVATGGGATIHYAGQKHTFANMDFVFFTENPGEVFAATPHKGFYEPISMWNIKITEDGMRHLLGGLGGQHTIPYFPNMLVPEKLNHPLARLTLETVQAFDKAATLLERESRLLYLLAEVIKHCSDTPLSERRLGLEHRAVALVKGYLQEHYAGDATLNTLSQLTELNKHHLLKVFQRDMNVSPHVYQTCLRIGKAKALLCLGTPIAQVAVETGFVDQSHFHHTFKKYVLVTPGKYQRDNPR